MEKYDMFHQKTINQQIYCHEAKNGGYLDKFNNEWTKGPSRTLGEVFEWDVQLSPVGKNKLGWASRDGKHLNVSLKGRITHE
jgi:filamentous hemagglutinin